MSWMWKKGGPRPDGEVRRSQILTRAGPGACVDLIDHAVVISGLDVWQFAGTEKAIEEPRLAAQALAMLQRTRRWHHGHVALRPPPECLDDQPSDRRGIPATTFPGWSLCQNPRCRSLVHWRALNEKGRHTCSTAKDDGAPVVPVRFVSACRRGHLTDIHWRAFVHRGVRAEDADEAWSFCSRNPGSGFPNDPLGDAWTADLCLVAIGTSGDMADYVVWCRKCGKNRGLQDLAIPNMLGTCKGWRPWLGVHAEEECTEKSKLLVRTASNAWFPVNVSALSLPDTTQDVVKTVERLWDHLKRVDSQAKLSAVVSLSEVVEQGLAGLDLGEVLAEIQRRHLGLPVEQPRLREAEWRALMAAPPEVLGELPERGSNWFPVRLDAELPRFLDRVVLVHAMKEVRAQVGFTRIDGLTGDAEGDVSSPDWERLAPLALHADWLPTVEVRGEGIFLAFDEVELRAWESREAVGRVESRFRAALKKDNVDHGADVPFGGARLLLLHSLAHMLITTISLSCGYPASSIRERIYCHRDDHPEEGVRRSRAGILLYTGTPGAEGTLGGLVQVGRDIVTHLRRAAEGALLCSNDPICAQHDPAGPEEGRRREGAACHACLLIAEPSCERMNHDLDRSLVVPTVEGSAAAFLRDWLG